MITSRSATEHRLIGCSSGSMALQTRCSESGAPGLQGHMRCRQRRLNNARSRHLCLMFSQSQSSRPGSYCFENSAMSWWAQRCEARGDAGSALASLTAHCLRFTNSVRSNEHLACAWCSFGRMLEVARDSRRAPLGHLWPSGVQRCPSAPFEMHTSLVVRSSGTSLAGRQVIRSSGTSAAI